MSQRTKDLLLIVAGAAVLFLPGLGGVHLFDWDEINFAESAREMLVTGNYARVQINFQPFWEKPPLFIWLQALCMQLFGVGEYAARLPNALAGVVTLLVFYTIGRRHFGRQFGLLWAVLYACTILPHLYFKSGIIDPIFNLFIFLSIYCTYLGFSLDENRKKLQQAALAGLFCGLAILTKGPVAALVWGLTVAGWVVWKRQFSQLHWPAFLVFLGVLVAVSAFWFLPETLVHGPWFIVTFIEYQIRLFSTQDAGHGGPFYYHWVVVVLGCFPASVLLLSAWRRGTPHHFRGFRGWMLVLALVVLVLFSLVKTKIVHYSSLAYFPVSFLGALGLYRLVNKERVLSQLQRTLLWMIPFLLALPLVAAPFAMQHVEGWRHRVPDRFARANLEAEVHWTGLEGLGAIALLAGAVVAVALYNRRKGRLAAGWLLGGSLLFSQVSLYMLAPRVEAITQRAAIDWLKQWQGQHVYVQPEGYKSYAHLFYTRKMPPADSAMLNRDTLLHGTTDAPVYVITRIDRIDNVAPWLNVEEVGQKNGFVFLRRAENQLFLSQRHLY